MFYQLISLMALLSLMPSCSDANFDSISSSMGAGEKKETSGASYRSNSDQELDEEGPNADMPGEGDVIGDGGELEEDPGIIIFDDGTEVSGNDILLARGNLGPKNSVYRGTLAYCGIVASLSLSGPTAKMVVPSERGVLTQIESDRCPSGKAFHLETAATGYCFCGPAEGRKCYVGAPKACSSYSKDCYNYQSSLTQQNQADNSPYCHNITNILNGSESSVSGPFSTL